MRLNELFKSTTNLIDAYRGQGGPIVKYFDPDKTRDKDGVWVSTSLNVAKKYARENRGTVYKLKIRSNKAATYEQLVAALDQAKATQWHRPAGQVAREILLSQGYDTMVWGDSILVLDPTAISSVEVIDLV